MMIDSKMEPQDAQNMLKGVSDHLHSEFHLGYNMLMNLSRIQDLDPISLIHRSFLQFQDSLKTPVIEKQMNTLQENINGNRVFLSSNY